MSDRRALMGALLGSSGGDIEWTRYVANRNTANGLRSAEQLFPTREEGHLYIAIITDKDVSEYANNQVVACMTEGNMWGCYGIRYRNNAFGNLVGNATSVDAVIEAGDTYLITDIVL